RCGAPARRSPPATRPERPAPARPDAGPQAEPAAGAGARRGDRALLPGARLAHRPPYRAGGQAPPPAAPDRAIGPMAGATDARRYRPVVPPGRAGATWLRPAAARGARRRAPTRADPPPPVPPPRSAWVPASRPRNRRS